MTRTLSIGFSWRRRRPQEFSPDFSPSPGADDCLRFSSPVGFSSILNRPACCPTGRAAGVLPFLSSEFSGPALDGSGLPPDGSGLPPDGSGLPPDGSAFPPDRSAVPPDRSAFPPDGSAFPPDGSAFPPDRSGLPPDGSVFPPDGSVFPPDRSGLPPDGSVFPPDGSVFPPERSGLPPDGSAFPPDGSGFPPERSGLPPDGSAFPPDGSRFPPGSWDLLSDCSDFPSTLPGLPTDFSCFPSGCSDLSLASRWSPVEYLFRRFLPPRRRRFFLLPVGALGLPPSLVSGFWSPPFLGPLRSSFCSPALPPPLPLSLGLCGRLAACLVPLRADPDFRVRFLPPPPAGFGLPRPDGLWDLPRSSFSSLPKRPASHALNRVQPLFSALTGAGCDGRIVLTAGSSRVVTPAWISCSLTTGSTSSP